ncbi:chorismate mutase [Russula aff. rugulosa BPL654]|nr:chorismate mutase [Russula aff. rugulosa BPL654]
MQANYTLSRNPLSLERIRSILTRLEDTIIFSLIERAQFAHNPKIYERGVFKELKELQFNGSWLEWFLKETEIFHGTHATYPFTSGLPEPILAINVNASILSFYIRTIVPRISLQATLTLACIKRSKGIIGDDELEDDGNYGSAATVDVEVLQAVSKRVHYGKFVSESKFKQDPAAFIPLIQQGDAEALIALITNPELNAGCYDGEPLPNCSSKGKIDVDCVVDLYESYIIPLTKEIEVEYLLKRLDGLSQEEIEKLKNSGH